MIDVLMTVVLCGQVSTGPIYYVPHEIVYVNPPTVEYWFGNWQKETEFQAEVLYGQTWRRVPIVNGFAPEIRQIGNKIIYDYRKRIPYEKCVRPEPEPMPQPQKLELAPLPSDRPAKPLPLYRDRGLLRPSDVK
jgi:hypothetical protein